MKMSMRVKVAAIAAVAVATAVVVRLFIPISAGYAVAERRNLAHEVFGTGTVEARVLVAAGSKVTGNIRELFADQGDVVEKGQLLAVLSNDDLMALAKQSKETRRKSAVMVAAGESELSRAEAAIVAAKAGLDRSEASLKLARRTMERYEELFSKGMISSQELDEKIAAQEEAASHRNGAKAELSAAVAEAERVRNAFAASKNDKAAAKASSEYAIANVAETYIRASLDGVVVSREAEEGDTVVSGMPIFRIADPDTVWITAKIDETLANEIEVGNPARIYLRSDRMKAVPGKVARIAQESDRVTEEIEVNLSFTLRDASRLHLGEQAEVYITGRTMERLSVPVESIAIRAGKEGVFVNDESVARFRLVKTGVWSDEFVEVIDGLGESDRVLVLAEDLKQRVKDGMRIRPTPVTDKSRLDKVDVR